MARFFLALCLAIVGPTTPVLAGPFVKGKSYGACLKEAAEAAVEKLNTEITYESPYRVTEKFSPYDRLRTGLSDDTLELRSFLPRNDRSETITWSNAHLSISVTILETENGCEVTEIELNQRQY